MWVFAELIFFGCYIVSLTLAPCNLQLPFALASFILICLTAGYGVWQDINRI